MPVLKTPIEDALNAIARQYKLILNNKHIKQYETKVRSLCKSDDLKRKPHETIESVWLEVTNDHNDLLLTNYDKSIFEKYANFSDEINIIRSLVEEFAKQYLLILDKKHKMQLEMIALVKVSQKGLINVKDVTFDFRNLWFEINNCHNKKLVDQYERSIFKKYKNFSEQISRLKLLVVQYGNQKHLTLDKQLKKQILMVSVVMMAKEGLKNVPNADHFFKNSWPKINNCHDVKILAHHDLMLVEKYKQLIVLICRKYRIEDTLRQILKDLPNSLGSIPTVSTVIEQVRFSLMMKVYKGDLKRNFNRDDRAQFSTYLSAIINNQIYDYLRKCARRINPEMEPEADQAIHVKGNPNKILEEMPEFIADVRRLSIIIRTWTTADKQITFFYWYLFEIENPFDMQTLGNIFPEKSEKENLSILFEVNNILKLGIKQRWEILSSLIEIIFDSKVISGSSLSKRYRRDRALIIKALELNSHILGNLDKDVLKKTYYKQLILTFFKIHFKTNLL